MAKNSHEEYLETLSKISKAITSDLFLDDILKLIVNLTANVMKVEICSLWLLDEKTKELKIRATQAMSKEYVKERSIKFGDGVVGHVAREKKPLIISNVLLDERYKEKNLAKKEGLVSMLSIPMMVKKKNICPVTRTVMIPLIIHMRRPVFSRCDCWPVVRKSGIGSLPRWRLRNLEPATDSNVPRE